MSTGKHYFIEENEDGKFAVRAKGGSVIAEPFKEGEGRDLPMIIPLKCSKLIHRREGLLQWNV